MPTILSRNLAAHHSYKRSSQRRNRSTGGFPKNAHASDRHLRNPSSQQEQPEEQPVATTTMTTSAADVRAQLRNHVHRRAASLTAEEQQFLDTLSICGDDKSIQVATKRLHDTNLFFDPERLDEDSAKKETEIKSSASQQQPNLARSDTKKPGLQRNHERLLQKQQRSLQPHFQHTKEDDNIPQRKNTYPEDQNLQLRYGKLVRRNTAPNNTARSPISLRKTSLPVDGDSALESQDYLFSVPETTYDGDCEPSLPGNSRKVPSQLMVKDAGLGTVSWCMEDDDDDDDASWKLDNEETLDNYDPWMAVQDEYINGYGGGGTLPFEILGTYGQDQAARPHVLSPPVMESLREFLPVACSEDNYWMKYSLIRDGASFSTFLQKARGSQCTLLALETVQGEVFGAFVGERWHIDSKYYGNLSSTFLWRMRRNRQEKWHSIIEKAHMESLIDVFPATGDDDALQFCSPDRIVVGGGFCSVSCGKGITSSDGKPIQDHEWGFGLSIESNLQYGTTSPCLTFGSKSMSKIASPGSTFEILNIELWTLTPCLTAEDANRLECSKLFLEENAV